MSLRPKTKALILMERYNNDKNICLSVVNEIIKRVNTSPSDTLFYMKVKKEIKQL
jgi:hypothetical protein